MKKVCSLDKKYAKGGSFNLLEELINNDILDEEHPLYDQAKESLKNNDTDEMCNVMDEMVQADLIDKDYPDYKAIKKAIKDNSEKEFKAFLKDPNLKKQYANYKKLSGADLTFNQYAKELFEYDKHADGGKITKPNDIVHIIDRAYLYKTQVINFKYPTKFLDKKIKNYKKEDFEKDLKALKAFDINLLYDKSFWGIKTSESISAVATGPYTKLKKILSADEKIYNYKGLEVDIRPGSNKHYIVWGIKSDQKFANEKFKSIKEAEDFVKENKMVLVRKKLFVGGGFEELSSPPSSENYDKPGDDHDVSSLSVGDMRLLMDILEEDGVDYSFNDFETVIYFDDKRLSSENKKEVKKLLNEKFDGGGSLKSKKYAHDISDKSVDDVAFVMTACETDDAALELNDRETIMYFDENELSAENKKKVQEIFGKMADGEKVPYIAYYDDYEKSVGYVIEKPSNDDDDILYWSGKEWSLKAYANTYKTKAEAKKVLKSISSYSDGGIMDSRISLLKKMDAKNPSATLKARIKLLEKMGKKKAEPEYSWYVFGEFVEDDSQTPSGAWEDMYALQGKDFKKRSKAYDLKIRPEDKNKYFYAGYDTNNGGVDLKNMMAFDKPLDKRQMADDSGEPITYSDATEGKKKPEAQLTQAEELAKQIIFAAGTPPSKIGTNDDHTIRMTWPELNLECTIDDEKSPIAPGILIQYKTVKREYTLKKIKDAINDISELKKPKKITYYSLNEHDEGGHPEFVEDLAVVEDNGMLDNKDFIQSLEAAIREARGFSPDEKFSFDEVWWDDIKEGKEFTTTDEDEDERIWYLTPKVEKSKPEPKPEEEPKPDTDWKSIFANPERFQKYGGEFLYPPRAENKVRPTAMMFGKLDNNTFIAEPKMNGSATSVTIFENTVVVKERHNTFFATPPTFDFKALHRGKGAMCIVGEFMNKSKKDEEGKPFRGFCIWDITAYEGQILIGSTIEERLRLIDKLYPTKGVIQTKAGNDLLYITEVPDIYKVAIFDKNFENLFKELTQIDMIEGFVLKRKNARLEMMTSEINNSGSFVKMRKPTANYEF